MYAENHAEIDRLHARFDQEINDRSSTARDAGDDYLAALSSLITAAGSGPASDPRLADLDTTGELKRVEEFVAWAEQERHRVRHALSDIR